MEFKLFPTVPNTQLTLQKKSELDQYLKQLINTIIHDLRARGGNTTDMIDLLDLAHFKMTHHSFYRSLITEEINDKHYTVTVIGRLTAYVDMFHFFMTHDLPPVRTKPRPKIY
jgi:hypothetical protein